MFDWLEIQLGTKIRWVLQGDGGGRIRLSISSNARAWAECYIEDLLEQGWVVTKGPLEGLSAKDARD